MKSLKSIFPFLSVSTKNKRECVKSEHFLRFWNASFALDFFEFKRRTKFFLFCSAYVSRTKRGSRKNKNEEIIPHRRRSRRLRRRRCRPTASSLSFLSAVSAVPTFVSPDRFWTRFDATDATTSFFSFSLADVRVRFDSHFKNDRWERSLMSLSLFSNKERERERKEAFIINAPLLKLLYNNNRNRNNRNNRNKRALCLKCKQHHSSDFFWRRWMKFQKFEPKKCIKMEKNSILELETTLY